MSLRVLIVDDESIARRRLRRMLRAESDIEILESAGGEDAVRVLDEQEIDLVFLDVQMPDLDAFEVVEAVGPDRMPVVVFVTAYDEFALRAFDVNAIDYLLKPVADERFEAAVRRARTHLEQRRSAAEGRRLRELLRQVLARDQEASSPAQPAKRRMDRIVIRSDGRIRFLRVADADWFEAAGNYVKVHVGANHHVIRSTLGALEEALDPARFVRCHRSIIVNIDRIPRAAAVVRRRLRDPVAGRHQAQAYAHLPRAAADAAGGRCVTAGGNGLCPAAVMGVSSQTVAQENGPNRTGPP